MPFDTEEYDDGVFASNTFTVPQGMPGLWSLEARLEFAADGTSTGRREIRFYKNGATSIDNVQQAAGTAAVSLALSTIVKLVGGDTVILQAYQNSGGNLGYNGSASDVRRFAAAYFGPRPS